MANEWGSSRRIIIVQGGQWGSEAKGAIAGYICEREGVDIAVRTGATNAGHTVYYQGKPVKMQQLPVGWVNPETRLVLGAGALIDPIILERECNQVSELTGKDVRKRLWIDRRAGVHLPIHTQRSKESGRHANIGATGKGASEALIDKIRGRGEGYQTFGHPNYGNPTERDLSGGYQVADTALLLNIHYDEGAKILLEGTQGTLLDLHLGPYPFTTHKQTTPANWMSECGLSPALPTDIVLVVRTYPIRVAGNSGPMKDEISWPILAREINIKRSRRDLPPIVFDETIREFEKWVRDAASRRDDLPYRSDGLDQHTWRAAHREEFKHALSNLNSIAWAFLRDDYQEELLKLFEMTTVTRKLRRVARLSLDDLAWSGMLNRPHRVAVTFMNYEFPESWYQEGDKAVIFQEDRKNYLASIQEAIKAPVTMASFGPESKHIAEIGPAGVVR